MNQPATASTEAIIAHPLFLELTRVRARLRWSCAAVVVAPLHRLHAGSIELQVATGNASRHRGRAARIHVRPLRWAS